MNESPFHISWRGHEIMMLLKQRCIASVCLGFFELLTPHFFFYSYSDSDFPLLSLQAFDLKRIFRYLLCLFLSFFLFFEFRISNIIYSILFELNFFFFFFFLLFLERNMMMVMLMLEVMNPVTKYMGRDVVHGKMSDASSCSMITITVSIIMWPELDSQQLVNFASFFTLLTCLIL